MTIRMGSRSEYVHLLNSCCSTQMNNAKGEWCTLPPVLPRPAFGQSTGNPQFSGYLANFLQTHPGVCERCPFCFVFLWRVPFKSFQQNGPGFYGNPIVRVCPPFQMNAFKLSRRLFWRFPRHPISEVVRFAGFSEGCYTIGV